MYILYSKNKASKYLLMPKVSIPLSSMGYIFLNWILTSLLFLYFSLVPFPNLSSAALTLLSSSEYFLIAVFFSSYCVPTLWYPVCTHLIPPRVLDLQLHWPLALKWFQNHFSGFSPLWHPEFCLCLAMLCPKHLSPAPSNMKINHLCSSLSYDRVVFLPHYCALCLPLPLLNMFSVIDFKTLSAIKPRAAKIKIHIFKSF